MRQLMFHSLTTLALTVGVLIATPTPVMAQTGVQLQDRAVIRRPIPRAALAGSTAFVRTELFFGTAKPDGVVSDVEFMAFIDEHVTPRFPDGLTLLKGDGQFLGEGNILVKEDSFLLILLYPVEDFRVSSRRIEVIRRLYKEAFQQESVLRVDDPFAVRVSF
jgi:hypothetical protein